MIDMLDLNKGEDRMKYAEQIFEEVEGRKPDLASDKDLIAISILEVGIKYGYQKGFENGRSTEKLHIIELVSSWEKSN